MPTPFTMAPGDEVVFAEMTRVTVRLENLDKRYAGARSADIVIDFPDGSRFPAMPPAMVQEQVDAQRERWTADLQEPPVQPQPDSTKATNVKEQIATGVLAAACLPALVGQVLPPVMLFTAPVCLGTLVTKDGTQTTFEIVAVTTEAIVGRDHRIELADIAELQKREISPGKTVGLVAAILGFVAILALPVIALAALGGAL